jgi:hypothetical protein
MTDQSESKQGVLTANSMAPDQRPPALDSPVLAWPSQTNTTPISCTSVSTLTSSNSMKIGGH